MATKAELKARLSLDASLFSRGISVAHAEVEGLGRAFSGFSSIGLSAFTKLAGAAAALGGAAGFGLAIEHAYQLGRGLQELSERTGITAGSLAVLQQAFKDAGLEADDVGNLINKMQKYISSAGEKGKLGAEFQRIKEMAPEQQFLAIADSIRRIEDPAKRAQAAMEIFGRGGGRILPLIMDPRKMEDAARAIGNQATILSQNARLFEQISIKLEHAGLVLRGFFLGTAAGLANSLLPVLNKIEALDFTKVGQRFGQALADGVKATIGFFNDPTLFTAAIGPAFKGSVLEMGNVLIAVFATSIQFFKSGMIAALAGIGSAILSTLLTAFAKPIAFLQAGIIKAVEAISTGGVLDVATKNFGVQWLENMTKGADESASILEKGVGKMLAEWAKGQLPAARADLAKSQAAAASAPKQSITDLANEIMKSGGPKFGLTGGGETADEMMKRSNKELNDAMDAAGKALKDFSAKDVLGAEAEFKKAAAAAAKAIEEGGKVLKAAEERAAAGLAHPAAEPILTPSSALSGISGGFTHPLATSLAPPTPAYVPPYLQSPGTALTSPGYGLNQAQSSAFLAGGQPLFRENSVLTAQDKESLVDQFVAQGGQRPTTSPEAYHAVKAGDDQRRLATQRQEELTEARGKLGLETTNDILKNIKTNTDALK